MAAEVGLPVADLVRVAEQRSRRPTAQPPCPTRRAPARENAEFAAIAQLAQDWDSIAEWLVEELFHDEANRRAFLALAAAGGKLDAAIEAADPEAREVLERAAVADLEVDPDAEARNLIGAAVRRQLAERGPSGGTELIRLDAEARRQLEALTGPATASAGPRSGCYGGSIDGWRNARVGGDRRPEEPLAPLAGRGAVDTLDGVDPAEWDALLDRGRQQGSLHAEQVTHVLRDVELTGDVLGTGARSP